MLKFDRKIKKSSKSSISINIIRKFKIIFRSENAKIIEFI